jgi:UDP-glucose 4-epimerase
VIFRLANVIGPRSQHGVIRDFIRKLRRSSDQLEILGDGTQTKSYLYITDCIQAIETAWKNSQNQVEIYNVGSEDQISVREIAEIVTQEMELGDIELRFTGGVDGGRGWKGDVKNMLLDISKLKSRGWSPKYTSQQAIQETVKQFID